MRLTKLMNFASIFHSFFEGEKTEGVFLAWERSKYAARAVEESLLGCESSGFRV
jgi:hypothetical protein